jgi:redox-sensitive bicupin YhaK (pirin superfamily)
MTDYFAQQSRIPMSSNTHAGPIEAVTALSFPWQTRDPFLFCAYHNDAYPAGNSDLGPAASLAGRHIGQDFDPRNAWRMYHGDVVPGFPQHPHRGFETVTIINQGYVDHADSLGAMARFGPGDVQWLTAGSGIVHAEMFPLLEEQQGNPLEMFQVWLNLPAADKMADPHFTMLWRNAIHRVTQTDDCGLNTTVRVIAGNYREQHGPETPPKSWAAKAHAKVSIWTIELEANANWTLPATTGDILRTLYFYDGDTIDIADTTVSVQHMIELKADQDIGLQALNKPAQLLLLEGRPIGESVAHHGPFVMNTRGELEQAFRDYQRTQFGGWPWANNAPVHERDSGRFAVHAGGKKETFDKT